MTRQGMSEGMSEGMEEMQGTSTYSLSCSAISRNFFSVLVLDFRFSVVQNTEATQLLTKLNRVVIETTGLRKKEKPCELMGR